MVSRNAFAVPSIGDQAAHRSVSAKDGAAASTATNTAANAHTSGTAILRDIRVSRPVIVLPARRVLTTPFASIGPRIAYLRTDLPARRYGRLIHQTSHMWGKAAQWLQRTGHADMRR